MAATPPLQIAVHTPPTPLHGARYDDYRPYSTRKSTRHTSLRIQRAIETPPPNSEDPSHDPASLDLKKPSTLRSAAHTYSPPSSAHTSPRKQSVRGRMSDNTTDANMNVPGSSSEAPSLDPYHNLDKNTSSQQPSLKADASMLPTPAKTPRQKPVQPAAVNAAARVLFPVHGVEDDSMPTPRKRRNRRHVGFSLYSSMEDDGDARSEGKIQIFTDSKDKVPELDPSEDNPFYELPAPSPEPSKGRTSRKRKAGAIAEDREEILEAFNREEGMVYVFRGKKIYRKFPEDGSEANDLDDSEVESNNIRPLTRSSIKPRLLFPTPKQRQEREAINAADEEAPTDIEDLASPEEEQIKTPVKSNIFSPTTPPTTIHATRSSTKKVALDSSPIEPPEPVEWVPKGKKVSPFDGWARMKAGTSAGVGGGKGKKREGDSLEKSNCAESHKKSKGNSVM